MRRFLILFLGLVLTPLLGFGENVFTPAPEKQLTTDQAFNLTLQLEDHKQVIANWQIKPGFMLYQNRIHITAASDSSATIGTPFIPRNDTIKQLTIENQPVFSFFANAYVPIKNPGNGQLRLLIQYQGCKGKTYCYPPTVKLADINLTTGAITLSDAPNSKLTAPNKTQARFNQSFFMIILSFLGFGLLLSFTPCVLPMLPILWKIISGANHHRPTMLINGGAYVLSMALCFTVLGIIAAGIGHTLQGYLQNAWVISIFCLIILLLALAQFDLIRFRLPGSLDNAFQQVNTRSRTGGLLAAISLGCLSSLVLSPCISAPLIAILLYIANTGNMVLGGVSLFFLALGMNLPLLALALLGSKILPKTGQWMTTTKHLSGFILLILTVWLLNRIIPGPMALMLYALVVFLLSLYFFTRKAEKRVYRRLKFILACVFLTYGALLAGGGLLGNENPLHPLQTSKSNIAMDIVTTPAELTAHLNAARRAGKPVLIDFYADWCVACKSLDKHVFSTLAVKQAMRSFVTIRVDLTQSRPALLQLAKQYQVYAPPSIAFYSKTGVPLKNLQIFGDVDQETFLQHLQQARTWTSSN